jgi:adenylosuccinate synthase
MSDLFAPTGVHILAGGQFGSEGKGALAAWLALQSLRELVPWNGIITSAGPNSGHTSWFKGEKIVLKQLPTFAVHLYLHRVIVPVYFSAGAVIDPVILLEEHRRYPEIPIFIHPNAAVVSLKDKEAERDPHSSIFQVAGTRSGTGAVLVRKLQRDPSAIYYNHSQRMFPYHDIALDPAHYPYFMEISQGFSLGLNSEFYPKVTSRECTFAQGMADARIAMSHYSRGYLCFRTFPIRVGNADGFDSGEWYPDQSELTWDEVGVPPEYTTVTNRIRRVAQFSWMQFGESMAANMPTHVFLNYLNYATPDERDKFIDAHRRYKNGAGFEYKFIYGFGPRVEDLIHQDSARIESV